MGLLKRQSMHFYLPFYAHFLISSSSTSPVDLWHVSLTASNIRRSLYTILHDHDILEALS